MICIIGVRVKETYDLAFDVRNASENCGAKILDHLNSMKNMLKESPRVNFIPVKFGRLLALREGLLFDLIVAIYMSLFYPCSSLMCIKWEVSSFLVMDIHGNSTLGTIKILKLLP
jgi:hypothetical protein